MNILYLTCRRFFGEVLVNKNDTFIKLSLAKTLLFKNKNILIVGLIPVIPIINAQSLTVKEENSNLSISKDNSNKKEIKSYAIEEEKTPWERVKAIYERDEYGNLSKELTTIMNTSCLAAFVGCIYGGVVSSRTAFVDFMERNQDTIFEHPLDAKRKLQNHVTIHFGKGAFRWAWRLTIFTGGFMSLFLAIHAYRGTTRLVDYAVSGAVVGALLRIKLGPPGIIVGGGLGGILGLFCGLANQSLLNLCGMSYDDMMSLQYKLDMDRYRLVDERIARDFEKSSDTLKIATSMLKDRQTKGKDI